MHKLPNLWSLSILSILTVCILSPSSRLFAKDSSDIQYEVLSPWGEADPKQLRGISPRLDDLSGKKIGLFANYKRAAVPIALALKEQLESKYPNSEFSVYHSDQWNVIEIETEKGEAFRKWVQGNDAVILTVGD